MNLGLKSKKRQFKKSVSMLSKKKKMAEGRTDFFVNNRKPSMKKKSAMPIRKGKSTQSQLSTATGSSMKTRIGRSVERKRNMLSYGLQKGIKKSLAQKSMSRV